MHTFGEKSSFFSLTDGYDGRFIGGLPLAEALQHVPFPQVHLIVFK